MPCFKLCKGDNSVNALQDFNVNMAKGEVLVIIGHNGAGKTTFINSLGGIYKISGGRVKFPNNLQLPEDSLKIQQSIGIVTQND